MSIARMMLGLSSPDTSDDPRQDVHRTVQKPSLSELAAENRELLANILRDASDESDAMPGGDVSNNSFHLDKSGTLRDPDSADEDGEFVAAFSDDESASDDDTMNQAPLYNVAKKAEAAAVADDGKVVKSTPRPKGRKRKSDARYFSEEDLSVKCHVCKEPGHLSYDCTAEDARRHCFVCGVPGHDAHKCRNEICYRCLEPGHQSRGCRNRPRSVILCHNCGDNHPTEVCLFRAAQKPTDLAKVRCMVCGTFGHLSCADAPYKEQRKKECANCGYPGHTHTTCDVRSNNFSGRRDSSGSHKKPRLNTHKRLDGRGGDVQSRAEPPRRRSSGGGQSRRESLNKRNDRRKSASSASRPAICRYCNRRHLSPYCPG